MLLAFLRALIEPRPMTEGARRGGFESLTVLLKLGHDLRARLDDTLNAPLPASFAPMLDALRARADADGAPGIPEPGADNVVPLVPRRRRRREAPRTRDEEDR